MMKALLLILYMRTIVQMLSHFLWFNIFWKGFSFVIFILVYFYFIIHLPGIYTGKARAAPEALWPLDSIKRSEP